MCLYSRGHWWWRIHSDGPIRRWTCFLTRVNEPSPSPLTYMGRAHRSGNPMRITPPIGRSVGAHRIFISAVHVSSLPSTDSLPANNHPTRVPDAKNQSKEAYIYIYYYVVILCADLSISKYLQKKKPLLWNFFLFFFFEAEFQISRPLPRGFPRAHRQFFPSQLHAATWRSQLASTAQCPLVLWYCTWTRSMGRTTL